MKQNRTLIHLFTLIWLLYYKHLAESAVQIMSNLCFITILPIMGRMYKCYQHFWDAYVTLHSWYILVLKQLCQKARHPKHISERKIRYLVPQCKDNFISGRFNHPICGMSIVPPNFLHLPVLTLFFSFLTLFSVRCWFCLQISLEQILVYW